MAAVACAASGRFLCALLMPLALLGAGACGRSDGIPVVTAVATSEHSVTIDSARSILQNAVAQGAGVAVAVVVRGDDVWAEGRGWADLEERLPVSPDATRFRLYSVSKPMTAVVAARLMERGALDPAAPIQRYVPGFPSPVAEAVTAMHLATHTSGIRHYADEAEAASALHCGSVEEALGIFARDPLLHAPGADETYSSWGYVLLSAVVEGAAGSSFERAMQTLLFEPAGMTHTTMDDPEIGVEGRATFYEQVEDVNGAVALRPAAFVDNTCKWGAGGYLSTAADVAAFGMAMLDSAYLAPASLELFMRGEDVYRAQGVGSGGASFLVVDRTSSLSVALLSNAVGDVSGPAAQRATARIHELFREALGR